MKQVRFEESEVPYQTLARFGLTQEKIEDLPMWALEDIGQGRRSPLLPIQVNNDEGETLKSRTRFALVLHTDQRKSGETLKSRTRFALVRMEDGKVDVVFYPQLEKSPLEAFTQEQQEDLLAGKAILADVKDADGRSSKAFVQIDTETNQVMSVPTPVIGRNLEVLKDELKLSSAELTVMQKGEPLTLIMEDEQVTVGIDLNDKTGIRINQGDSQKWKENTKREWDKYTFGCYGCWVMGDDGNLDYVPEEEYTEELWNEQKKNGERNRASFSMHK